MPFWSAFTDAYTQSDFDWMKNILRRINYLWYMILSLAVLMLLTSKIIFHIWIGDLVQIPFIVSILMTILVIINTRFSIHVMLINGIGKITFVLYLYILSSLIFIPLTIFLGKIFKLNGIILANIIIYLMFAILMPYQLSIIINGKAQGIWNK
jgi:O-antigen/teichoic acid export membrane protein